MSAIRPVGSLTAGMLARKGAARPAMRGEDYYESMRTCSDTPWNAGPADFADAAVASDTPLSGDMARRIASEMAERGARAALTLRLDAERHLRLRLASALTHRSAQSLMTEALDQFLAGLPAIDMLSKQLDAAAGRDEGE